MQERCDVGMHQQGHYYGLPARESWGMSSQPNGSPKRVERIRNRPNILLDCFWSRHGDDWDDALDMKETQMMYLHKRENTVGNGAA